MMRNKIESKIAPTHTGSPLLEVKNLRVSFETVNGRVLAVNDLNFSVQAGQRIGIVGESGSGKSVAAQALMGILRGADISGEIIFQGTNLLELEEDHFRKLRGWDISYVFQDPLSALDPIRTIGDQVSQVLRLRNVKAVEAKKKTLEILDRVGIKEPQRRYSDYPHQFSGGMRQRAMIAMALIGEPSLVIADEPTTSLDVRVQAQVIDLLNKLTEEQGTAVIFITHDLSIMAGFAEHVHVMYAGNIVESAKTDEIYYRSIHPYTLGLLGSIPRISGPVLKSLTAIKGKPPAPTNIPPGCPFHPRCTYASSECAELKPTLITHKSGNHLSACHNSELLSQKTGSR
jgi:oligopeptide/dipeptide ABC transporter ATP-binding protein